MTKKEKNHQFVISNIASIACILIGIIALTTMINTIYERGNNKTLYIEQQQAKCTYDNCIVYYNDHIRKQNDTHISYQMTHSTRDGSHTASIEFPYATLQQEPFQYVHQYVRVYTKDEQLHMDILPRGE